MPPFRTGLLKRKSDSTKKDADQKLSDEGSNSSEEEEILKNDFNLEGDDTDSEKEASEEESDQEQDEVLFQSDDEADALGDDSSELPDSEEDGDEDSDDEADSKEGDDSEVEGEREDRDGSEVEAESEVGNTHSINSDSDKKLVLRHHKRRPKEKTTAIDQLADTINKASINTQPVAAKDEYESGDTSDEEDRRTTAGGVPRWWYRDYPHLGYDLDARPILKPPQRDHIDDFLKRCEDPEFWRTVRDPATGQDVVLSAADLELLARLRAGAPPSDAGQDEPWVEWFTRDVLAAPLRAFPDHKRSFLPSRADQRAVSRLVHALRMGWLKTRRELAAERRARRQRRFYDLWGSAPDAARGLHRHIPAPRRALPSHAESYNPPPEYLLDAKEMKEWEALAETPWKRKYTFLPTRHSSLRAVAAYPRFTRERFLRCLDLYLAPRAIKMRLTVGPDELVPRLPAPRDLRPFPSAEALVLRGHGAAVRCCSFDPSGQYAVSGGDDRTARVWEVATGRCLRTLELPEPVTQAAWSPAAGLSLVALAAGARLLLWSPGAGVGAHRAAAATDALLEDAPGAGAGAADATDARTAAAARWERVAPEEWARGVRVAVAHFRPVTHVAWHARGDYLAVTLRDAAARAVLVHQLSRRRSQLPFARSKGLVQCAAFHPTRPLLFVATQRAVRVYDLVRGELARKLRPGAQWISSLAVHPSGDHLLVGAYDRKAAWFDLELSAAPYRTLRLHGGAVRAVAFHRRYPLWASAGDDGALVGHGAVFAELTRDPLLVPLRRLAVPRAADLSALHLAFHPTQPWLLVAAADHTLRLYT